MKSKVLFALILIALAAALAAPLHADERVIPPTITKVWPAGMQRGTTATFTLDGRNLFDIKAAVFDSPGITAKVMQISDVAEKARVVRPGRDTDAPVPRGKMQSATIEVTAAKDVAPGLHWFRVHTPLGTFEPFALRHGILSGSAFQ